ncbi:MAG TPA: hypothetical protein VGO96_19120 [Pyrinomonadaceae bacterium]|nr:hypothetical protein [Pyrinomonadaceae bacterium]
MKLNTMFLITAILTFIGGLIIIAVPEMLMSFFTGRPMVDKAPVLYIQWFGVALLGFSVMTWRARNLSSTEARRTILITMFAYCVVGAAVTGRFQLTGVLNSWGWFFPGHLAALGLCYAYYLFVRKDLIGNR